MTDINTVFGYLDEVVELLGEPIDEMSDIELDDHLEEIRELRSKIQKFINKTDGEDNRGD